MSVYKIVGLAGLALAVIAAFVSIPYAALLLAICGMVVGWATPAEAHVRVIVSALALRAFAGLFESAPAVGTYLTSIIGNLAMIVAGAAVLIILRNMVNRIRG